MKTITFILLILLSGHCVYGQGVLGFFDQQGTKKKRMAEQIALLEMYLGEVKKGYSVVEHGINNMHDLKNGTFSLHTAYINSLSAVSPAVASYPAIRQITGMANDIRTCFTTEIKYQQQAEVLTGPEMYYLNNVYQHLLSELNKDLAQLSDVLTPGKLQLKDEERLSQIDQINMRVKDKYAFSRTFTAHMRALAASRIDEQQATKILKRLYQIN
ncbi:MAG: hypothetical protein JSU01_00670 [Bacteroidetes bacterium]|nr:hypothetical protein [Bacteroidota bacterium]